jgi:hypothetical protein
MKRIIVTGSRNLKDSAIVSKYLDRVPAWLGVEASDVTVVHGGANGADELAACWARAHGAAIEEHRADWDAYGFGAGPKRNAAMVALGADICVGFWDSKRQRSGTLDCLSRADEAMIPTLTIKVKV